MSLIGRRIGCIDLLWRDQRDEEEEHTENCKGDQAAFLLSLKVAVGARDISAVPASQPHVVSVSVLLRGVRVTHPRSAALEERVHATERHGLVAVPVGNVLARLPVVHQTLAVKAFAERVSVLLADAINVARLHKDGLGVCKVLKSGLVEVVILTVSWHLVERVGGSITVDLADQVITLSSLGQVLNNGLVFGNTRLVEESAVGTILVACDGVEHFYIKMTSSTRCNY